MYLTEKTMILQNISIDTNILNHCVDEKIEASDFNALLKSKGFMPLLVPHVIYECAGCFVDENQEKTTKPSSFERGLRLFSYIKELKPNYSCRRDHLYKMEVAKIKNDTPVEYKAGSILDEHIQVRIDDLCNGKMPIEQVEFIFNRKKILLFQIRNIFSPEEHSKKSFDEVKKDFFTKIHLLDNELCNSLIEYMQKITENYSLFLSKNELIKLAKDINSYPALMSAIFSNLYIQFKSTHNTIAKDKFSDFLILTESAYCSALLSNEERLKEHFNQINPNVEVITYDDLIALP